MGNKYKEMRERHQAEINEFPLFFAFNQKQFEEGARKLGVDLNQEKCLVDIGYGGYCRKTDADKYVEMLTRFETELDEAIAADVDGTDFTYEMFLYELANHEYCITYDYDDTLAACGLSAEDIEESAALKNALFNATETYLKQCDDCW